MTLRLLTVLLVCFSVGACSTVTRRVAETRLAPRMARDGLTVEVEFRRVETAHSAGLRESGRWFGWEAGSTDCNVFASLTARKAGAPDRVVERELETDPPRRLFMDGPQCKTRFQQASVESCDGDGKILVVLDGEALLVTSLGDWLFVAPVKQNGATCGATLAQQPDIPMLAALSGDAKACPALLEHADTTAATVCFLNYGSRVGSSATREGVANMVERSAAGEDVEDLRAVWAGRISRGKEHARDYEAALYRVLLLDPAEADRFDTAAESVTLGLAYAPSKTRRQAYLDAVLQRCAAGTLTPWQKNAAARAVTGLEDHALSARFEKACGVAPVPVDVWYGTHLR